MRRIDLIQNPERKAAIVHCFEDRRLLVVTLNGVWQDAVRGWWAQAADQVEVLGTDLALPFPHLRGVDADAFMSDRVAIVSAGDLSDHGLDLRTYVVEVLELNEARSSQVGST